MVSTIGVYQQHKKCWIATQLYAAL